MGGLHFSQASAWIEARNDATSLILCGDKRDVLAVDARVDAVAIVTDLMHPAAPDSRS